MTFAEKLKSIRKKAGLSQEQLAEKLGVSRQAVTKWETETGIPDIENMMAISALFDISIDELLSNEKGSKKPIDIPFEGVRESDLDEPKRYDMKFGGAKQFILSGYEGEKIRVCLASNTLSTLQNDFKVKIDDIRKRIDVDVNRRNGVLEATAKEAVSIFVQIPSPYIGKIECAVNAEIVEIRSLECDSIELDVKTPNIILEDVSGTLEINCNLDMEVGKLNMLKASYLSQKYALEDMVLKKYPETITRLTERIAGYEQDLQLATAHRKPQEGFAGITILEQLYADKEAAGKAILDVCTKMTGSDAVFLGQYRGFSLVLSYDGPSNEYRMTMKGTLSHTAVLGADVFGNLTRMDNVIDGLSGKLEAVRAELADTQVQLENARTELAAPFAKEAELAEKTARLKELNILLNMDQKDKSLIDDVPDEDTPERSRSKGLER